MEEQYAEIIVDVAHSSVDKIFDYALIEGMDVQPGSRVIVPFGNMRTEGIVLSKKEQTDLPKNKIRQEERVAVSYTHLDVYKRQRLSCRHTTAPSGPML